MAASVIADIERLIDDLIQGGPVHPGRLTVLSELTGKRQESLAARWSEIPAAMRESLIDEAAELAETRLDLNFDELGRIALHDPEPVIRVKAIASFWETVNLPVAEDLMEALATDTEEAVRAAAATSLETIVLAHEFGDVNAAMGDRVVAALRAVVADEGEPVNVQGAALEAVAGRALPWVATLIKDAYYHDDREMRLSALRAMGNTVDTRWLEILEEDLTSGDADVRMEAATAVGKIGEEDSVEMLAPLLDDEDQAVIIATLRALGNIAGEEATGLLRQFASRTDDEELRQHAHEAQDVASILDGDVDDEDDAWDE